MTSLLNALQRQIHFWAHHLRQLLLRWTQPTGRSWLGGTRSDLTRPRAKIIAENALPRQHLILLRRQIKRPICKKTERILLLLRARAAHRWKQVLFIVQPDTFLGWHRGALRSLLEEVLEAGLQEAQM